MFSRSEASTLQRTELNYVLPSSRLPQYKRLAALGHKLCRLDIAKDQSVANDVDATEYE